MKYTGIRVGACPCLRAARWGTPGPCPPKGGGRSTPPTTPCYLPNYWTDSRSENGIWWLELSKYVAKFYLKVTDDITVLVKGHSLLSVTASFTGQSSHIKLKYFFFDLVPNQGHLRSQGQKRSNLKFWVLGGAIHFLGHIFVKNAKNDCGTLFEWQNRTTIENWKNVQTITNIIKSGLLGGGRSIQNGKTVLFKKLLKILYIYIHQKVFLYIYSGFRKI